MGQPTGMIEMGVRGPNIANALSSALRDNLSIESNKRQNEQLLLNQDANKRANHSMTLADNKDKRDEKRLTLSENDDKRATERLYSQIYINKQANDRANGLYNSNAIDGQLKSQLDGINDISHAISSAYNNSITSGVDKQTSESNAIKEGYKIYKLTANAHNMKFPNSEQLPLSEQYYINNVVPKAHAWYSAKINEIQKEKQKQNIKISGTNAINDHLYGLKTNLEKLKSRKGRSTNAGKSDIEILNPGANGGTVRVPYEKLHSMWKQETDRAIRQNNHNNTNDTDKISNKKREKVITFDDYILKLQGKPPKAKKGLSRSEQAMREQGLMTASQISSQGN